MAKVDPIDLPNRVGVWLALHGRRPGTVRKTTAQLKLLLSKGVVLSTPTNIQTFLATNVQTYSSSYINNFIDSARNYAHCAEEYNLEYDPILLTLKHFKERTKPKATMSDEEIESFVNLPVAIFKAKRNGHLVEIPADPKGHMIFTMFWKICAFSGMRMGEVAHLRVNQVDFGRSVFTLGSEDTKTNEPRYVPIAPNITSELSDYVTKLQSDKLFPSRRGGKKGDGCFDEVDWGYNFKKRINRLGIKRYNLTPYSLRHSLITRLLEEDVNIFKVQKIVGHKDIKTTSMYTHLTTKDIIAAISKHPLIRKTTDPHIKLKTIEETIAEILLDDKRFEVSRISTNESLEIKIKIN